MLNADKDGFNFRKLFYGSKKTQQVRLHNTLEDSVHIEPAETNTDIRVKINPVVLPPSQYGRISVLFETKNREYGKFSVPLEFNLKLNDKIEKDDILITGEIIEDFSSLTQEERSNPPILNVLLENNVLILKDLKPEKSYKKKIEIENTGKRELIIRNIQTHDFRFKIEPKEFSVKPGEKGSFMVSVKPTTKAETLKTIISVISNDPKNSVHTFTIVGKVDLPKGSAKKNPTIDVDVMKANKLISSFKGSDNLVILDVRTKDEYENGCIEGATNLDVQDPAFDKMLKLMDMKKVYLVYCQAGIRSKIAADKMQELGYKKVYHMHEGIEGWKRSRLKLSDPN